jgi:hypothetical protein
MKQCIVKVAMTGHGKWQKWAGKFEIFSLSLAQVFERVIYH